MYTVNYTNFFDFVVDSGDAHSGSYLGGSDSGDAHSGSYLDGSGSGYTNFLAFGVNVGDAQSLLDGSSPPIILSTPIQFFGTTQDTLFVSQLCILSLTETTDHDWCFMCTLVIMNNNAETDFCSS